MGQKYKKCGLEKRGSTWYIHKTINGRRVRQSTGTDDLKEAERYLAHFMEEMRKAEVYGVRPKRTFKQAGFKYIETLCADPDVSGDAIKYAERQVKRLNHFIGTVHLDQITMQNAGVRRYIQEYTKLVKRKVDDPEFPGETKWIESYEPVKRRTINAGLATVRRICNLATTEWYDDTGLTWLHSAPKIKLFAESDSREPYALSWDEQDRFFNELPEHLRDMALFKVNVGCRTNELCNLRWDWEYHVEQIDASLFLVPKEFTKNREGRAIVLNRIASDVIEKRRGKHPTHVFVYDGHPITRLSNSAWRRVRKKTGIDVRPHDLRHTIGRRLRAAGVSREDRKDLLGHTNGEITTSYSPAEIQYLIDIANQLCNRKKSSPVLRLIQSNRQIDTKLTQSKNVKAG